MRRIGYLVAAALLIAVALYWFVFSQGIEKQPPSIQFMAETHQVAAGLSIPWQMNWLPSGEIVFTELTGTIKKVEVENGLVTPIYQIPNLAREIQCGLLGLALHPNFKERQSLFVAYNYYDQEQIYLRVDELKFWQDTLEFMQTVVDRLPSFPISIGGTLLIGNDQKLWITVGEGSDSELSQADSSLAGKVLRYNVDGSIPVDNPDPLSPIWSKGFRNPQALTQTPFGIYVTEHGTFSNDELNHLRKGGNYGWPLVSGLCDTANDCGDDRYIYPIAAWTPTVAPGGMAFYENGVHYPFLNNSLMVACLKGQKLLVQPLDAKGQSKGEHKEMLNNQLGRIRSVLVNPEGRIFVGTSNTDVYGTARPSGDAIYEIIPRDSLVTARKQELNPPSSISLDSSILQVTVLADHLTLPWDLNWVGRSEIWFNERGGAIKQVKVNTGQVVEIHQIQDVFESSDNSGMHGFAVHPDYPAKPYFYGHFSYELYKSRLVRYEVDPDHLKVVDEKVLLPELEGNKSHNGSRIVFGPDGKIYFCIGDGYKRRAAQKLDRFNGKVLRLNDDGSIPEDNPIPDSYIFTLGHRNPQGLDWGSNGVLYASEHGSSNDDEINILLPGANYGFPSVQGFCDDWSERRFCERKGVIEPIYSWTPTIGPAGIAYYDHSAIPEWQNSLLITTLKSGYGTEGQRLLQARLSADGKEILQIKDYLTFSFGRLRDVMVAPDGSVFICTSNQESNQNALEVVQEADDRIIRLSIYVPGDLPAED